MWHHAKGLGARGSREEDGAAELPGDCERICHAKSLLAIWEMSNFVPKFNLYNNEKDKKLLCLNDGGAYERSLLHFLQRR